VGSASVQNIRVNAPNLPEHVSTCKACRKPVSWENLVRFERELQPRVFERCYVCPHCRAVLEFATWQTGVSRKY
jgi:hypothetical protein